MHISTSNRPTICITMGYPAGIGPQVIARALASSDIKRLANFLIIGDAFVFQKACELVHVEPSYVVVDNSAEIDSIKNSNILLDLHNVELKGFGFGKVCSSCGAASVEYIRQAVSLVQKQKAALIVTAPIHKLAAQSAHFSFHGHTEYLAHLTGTRDFAMMFAGGPLKVVLATTHCALRDVYRQINKEKIYRLLLLMNLSLKEYFGISKPSIAVCGLNPHAGEGGMLGNEEKKVILPAVKAARKRHVDAQGPLSADAVFYSLLKGGYDACLSMYHDQGLVALKMIARDESVNITLGLPFIRTSPAHGTALDIAPRGSASCEGMKQAIRSAFEIFTRQVRCLPLRK